MLRFWVSFFRLKILINILRFFSHFNARPKYFFITCLSAWELTYFYCQSLRDSSCVFLKRDAALVMVHSKSVCNSINRNAYFKKTLKGTRISR